MEGTLIRPQFNRFGPAADYRGAHVLLKLSAGVGRLGEIREVYRRESPPAVMARVIHFNGEPWPEPVALSALMILNRNV